MNNKNWCNWCFILGVTCAMSGGNAMLHAQATKQLKTPAAPKVVVEKNQAEDQNSQTEPGNLTTKPGTGTSESYSIVIENKMGSDGKRIRTKKVWKNGNLVEDRQDVVEGNEPDADASVILSDGEMAPGMILRSERSGEEPFDPLGDMSVSPKEVIRRFEQQFRRRQEEQARRMDAIRRQGGLPPFSRTDPNHGIHQKPSEFWIGASIIPVPEILAAQLDLGEGKGALVVQIVPDSPAAKAGIKKYDILVKAGTTEINDLTAIGKLLDQEKGKVQVFDVYRKGKLIKVSITPEKRPNLTDDLIPGDSDDNPRRSQIRVVRPGIIVPAEKAKNDPKPEKKEPAKNDTHSKEKQKSQPPEK